MCGAFSFFLSEADGANHIEVSPKLDLPDWNGLQLLGISLQGHQWTIISITTGI